MADKPFRILGIQQIAVGGPTSSACARCGWTCFGLQVRSTFVSERENVDEDICALGSGPTAVEVDLMQPLDPERKPAVHATPLNHVGLWVDDLPRAVRVDDGARRALRPGRHPQGCRRPRHLLHPPASGNDEFPLGGRGRADRARAGAARGGGGPG
jgi:lactoylglutathione lyase